MAEHDGRARWPNVDDAECAPDTGCRFAIAGARAQTHARWFGEAMPTARWPLPHDLQEGYMTSFPTSIDAVTAPWLSQVLGRNVRGIRTERFGEGAGVIGMVCRIHLDADDGPASLIAKFPSPAPANRFVAHTYDMYGREVNFYQHVASRLRLRTPACYYAAFDADSQDFVLLIEDLQGYRTGDQVAGCTLAEAKDIIEALAALHASTWQSDDLPNVKLHDAPMQREGMIAGFKLGWPAVLERFADLVPQSALRIGDRYPDQVPKLLERMCRPPVCLSHGDVRIDNVFYGDGEIALVDWQAVCLSAPEHDVAYFITQSVPKSVRAEEDLLLHYHRALTGHGVDYPLDACRQRYEICALYFLCYAIVIAGTLDMGNERGVQLARSILDGAMSALEEMGSFRLIR
jgi:thiamine kinase-like enzyme